MASVYVYRPYAFTGSAVIYNIELDYKEFGTIGLESYLFGNVEPGIHILQAINIGQTKVSPMKFDAQAGKLYFFKVHIGVWSGFEFERVDENEGRELISDYTLSGDNVFELYEVTDEYVKTLNVYKQKTLDELGPFDFEKRMYIFETINELAYQLKKSPKYSLLIEEKRKIPEEVNDIFYVLKLEDRDMDGKADQFAFSEKGEDTQDYGFIFDLNRDGKIDYIVFNGGPMITKGLKIVWQNYHWIDSNYDEEIDIFVYNNNIDSNSDKSMDNGISGWVYDTDFDGLVDKAEYRGYDFVIPIKKENDVFTIKTIFGDTEYIYIKNEFRNQMLSEINSILP